MNTNRIDVEYRVDVRVSGNQDDPVLEWTAAASGAVTGLMTARELAAREIPQAALASGRLIEIPSTNGAAEDEDLSAVVAALWDRARQTRPEFGVTCSQIVLVDTLRVEAAYRGHRLGERLIGCLKRIHPHAVIACIPGIIEGDPSPEAKAAVRAYWSRLGFRPAATDERVYWCYGRELPRHPISGLD